jgi:hypothetical protein
MEKTSDINNMNHCFLNISNTLACLARLVHWKNPLQKINDLWSEYWGEGVKVGEIYTWKVLSYDFHCVYLMKYRVSTMKYTD